MHVLSYPRSFLVYISFKSFHRCNVGVAGIINSMRWV